MQTQMQRSVISYYFSLLHSSPNAAHLRHLHAYLLRTSLYNNVVLSSKLVLMYSKHQKLFPHSISVFHHMPHKNIFSWNIILGELSRSHSPHIALHLFHQMWTQSHIPPDHFTLPLVLRACASLRLPALALGFSLHALCLKTGFDTSLFVSSALVSFYVTNGNLFHARVLFDEIPQSQRDAVLWTSMLAGYAQHEEPLLGLEIFTRMLGLGVEIDDVVMFSLLLICGQLGWLKHGKSVHAWCVRRCLGLGLNLGNAIIDMYVKSSKLTYARSIFDQMNKTDVISWSSIILGYGLSGSVSIALELFDRMRQNGVEPNDVTFLGVLSACAHGGLVDRARTYFKMMQDLELVPELKHYASMVDCLARAGLLEEAERFVEQLPMEPDAALLGAILGGCRVHNNVEVGERIAKKLIRLGPEKAGYYVLLSNIYAAAGRFGEAEKVRISMKERNVSKAPGCSLIESKRMFSFPT